MTATIAGVAAGLHAVSSPPAEKVTPGILGFLVVFALALVVLLLIRSMVGHMRKVRYSPDPSTEAGAESPGAGDGTGDGTVGGEPARG